MTQRYYRPAFRSPWQGMRRRGLIVAALPLAAMAVAGAPRAQAAGVDPLPAVAAALKSVTSYQVTITSSSSGPRFRPTGTSRPTGTPRAGFRRGSGRGAGLGFGPGPQTRTIVAVRKGNTFEEYIVLKGRNRSGKTATTSFVVYGAKVCTRASGARSYTCRTPTSQFSGQFNMDPTVAFEQGAGSTTFARTRARTVEGQVCDGYTYINSSQTATAKGAVYIARTTHLPCEQDATITRRIPNGGGTFTVPSIPA